MKTCKEHVDVLQLMLATYTGSAAGLCELAKVSRAWLIKFKAGLIPNPGTETVDRVRTALELIAKAERQHPVEVVSKRKLRAERETEK